MGVFFVYSIKVAICLVAFYLIYKLLLSRDTFHAFNRVVLLSVIILSILLPFIKISMASKSEDISGLATFSGLIMMSAEEAKPEFHFTLIQSVFSLYIIGVVFFLLREFVSIAKLHSLIRSGRMQKYQDGIRLVTMKEDIAPFSWFNYIIISEKDYLNNSREILTHERAHIARHHSMDILLCNILIIFQWFNPAVWLLKIELQNVHEFEADDAVLRQGVDAASYQMLLIRKAVGERLFTLANNLNHNSLTKRINMMTIKKTNGWNRLKVATIIPVAAVAVVAFASPKTETMAQKINSESSELVDHVASQLPESVLSIPSEAQKEVTDTLKGQTSKLSDDKVTHAESDGKTIDVAETMPQFTGGSDAMMQYLCTAVKYPKTAEMAKKEGRVVVSFIVDKDGTITDSHVIRSISPDLDAEALRVVNNMPKWKPGTQGGEPVRVKYSLPIAFRLNSSKNTKSESSGKGELPMIVVIGQGGDYSTVNYEELKTLKPDEVKSINVLKGSEAKKKYGEAAVGGVIEVTKKK